MSMGSSFEIIVKSRGANEKISLKDLKMFVEELSKFDLIVKKEEEFIPIKKMDESIKTNEIQFAWEGMLYAGQYSYKLKSVLIDAMKKQSGENLMFVCEIESDMGFDNYLNS